MLQPTELWVASYLALAEEGKNMDMDENLVIVDAAI